MAEVKVNTLEESRTRAIGYNVFQFQMLKYEKMYFSEPTKFE